jgi:hypothetical protein
MWTLAETDGIAEQINPKVAQLITLELANMTPPVAPQDHGQMTVQCKWCDATTRYHGQAIMRAHSWHADDCLWRLAVEAVDHAEAQHRRTEQ